MRMDPASTKRSARQEWELKLEKCAINDLPQPSLENRQTWSLEEFQVTVSTSSVRNCKVFQKVVSLCTLHPTSWEWELSSLLTKKTGLYAVCSHPCDLVTRVLTPAVVLFTWDHSSSIWELRNLFVCTWFSFVLASLSHSSSIGFGSRLLGPKFRRRPWVGGGQEPLWILS